MLHANTLGFLSDLKSNNTKEWFDANKKQYNNAKEDFLHLVATIITDLGKKDEAIALLQPKECVFRINRDVRFSPNKSPYKSNMGASFSKGGKKSMLAGYYLHVEPGQSFVGGGVWMPETNAIKKIRQEIDYSFSEFSQIVNNPTFKDCYGKLSEEEGTKLVREPKGYEKDNPAIEYLKLKSWVATKSLTDKELTHSSLSKTILAAFETLQPLIQFLNRGLEAND